MKNRKFDNCITNLVTNMMCYGNNWLFRRSLFIFYILQSRHLLPDEINYNYVIESIEYKKKIYEICMVLDHIVLNI